MLGCASVQPGDLVGTWVIAPTSRQSLPAELQKASARFVLNANGTFVASNVPGLFYFPGSRSARSENGSGVWKLVSRDGGQQIQLDFQVIVDWKEGVPYGTQLGISRGRLFYFL